MGDVRNECCPDRSHELARMSSSPSPHLFSLPFVVLFRHVIALLPHVPLCFLSFSLFPSLHFSMFSNLALLGVSCSFACCASLFLLFLILSLNRSFSYSFSLYFYLSRYTYILLLLYLSLFISHVGRLHGPSPQSAFIEHIRQQACSTASTACMRACRGQRTRERVLDAASTTRM